MRKRRRGLPPPGAGWCEPDRWSRRSLPRRPRRFAGIYVLLLGHVMPYLYAPIVLLVIAALLMITGALVGPETREAELHLPDLGLPVRGAAPAI